MEADNNRGMRDWLIFIRVSELGSLSQAARELSVSTAAVSKAINRLETYLGVVLFIRNSQGVSLTRIGHKTVAHAQGITQSFRELLDEIRNPDDRIKGTIHLSAPAIVCEFLANQWAYEYSQINKEVKIFLDSRERTDLHRESPEFDDLVLRSGRMDSEDLVHRRLSSMKLVLCASPTYLKKNPPILHPEDLREHIFFSLHHHGLSESSIFYKGEESYTLDNYSATGVSANNLLSILNLVLDGKGISIATPGWLASGYAAHEGLQVVLPDWKMAELPVWLVWRQRARYSTLFTNFLDFITDKWNNIATLDNPSTPLPPKISRPIFPQQTGLNKS